jgi:VanZ family protein
LPPSSAIRRQEPIDAREHGDTAPEMTRVRSPLPARFWRLAFWGCCVFATFMALLPKPPHMPIDSFGDKFEHVLAFAVLSGLALQAFPATSLLCMAAWLCAFGAAIEVAQAVPALHRDSDVVDWLVDTAVVILVLGVAALLRRRRRLER